MHIEPATRRRSAAGELFLHVVVAKDVTDVLTKKTFDALA